MEITNYIKTLFLSLLIINSAYSQKQTSIKIIEHDLTVDFGLLNRFETLSTAPYDSPFHISYDNPKYLGFIDFKFDSLLSNGDTVITLMSNKIPYKVECHYSERKPIDTWRVYDGKGALKSRILFSCGIIREIEFLDSIGNLICLIEYPEDIEKRSEKWLHNGKPIKSVFKNCDGMISVSLYNEKGIVSWLFRYNDKKLIGGTAYDENGLTKYSLNPR